MRLGFLCVLVVCVLALPALATTDGIQGTALARGMWCDIQGLFSGSTGLLVGFAVALFGLWQMIQGKGMIGLVMIAGGAAVTQLPALIETVLDGIGGALQTSGMGLT